MYNMSYYKISIRKIKHLIWNLKENFNKTKKNKHILLKILIET